MKILNQTLMAASLSLFAVVPAFASHGHDQTVNPRIVQERLDHQHQRIEKGIESRQLTHKEAKTLRLEQRDIKHHYRRFHEDGRYSKKELRYLDRRQDQASLHIKRLKHNQLTRYVHLHERYGRKVCDRRL